MSHPVTDENKYSLIGETFEKIGDGTYGCPVSSFICCSFIVYYANHYTSGIEGFCNDNQIQQIPIGVIISIIHIMLKKILNRIPKYINKTYTANVLCFSI